jgi:hypothetical protein
VMLTRRTPAAFWRLSSSRRMSKASAGSSIPGWRGIGEHGRGSNLSR